MRSTYSPTFRRAKVTAINAMVKSGKTISDACKKAKIPAPYYYRWRDEGTATKTIAKQTTKQKTGPKVQPIPRNQLACIFGSPEEIGQLLRRLS